METLTLLVALVGCVFSQPPMPALPLGCDPLQLRQCMTRFVEDSRMNMSDPAMGFVRQTTPNLDTVCGLLGEVKDCMTPKLDQCGREMNSVFSAMSKAVHYMCVEARAETEKFEKCFEEHRTETAFLPCLNRTMTAMHSVQAHVMSNPFHMKRKFCGILADFEQCFERTSGAVCKAEAYVTKLFEIMNSGMSFLDCSQLKTDDNLANPVRDFDAPRKEDPDAEAMMKRPFQLDDMQCVKSRVRNCVGPLVSRLGPADWSDADKVCSAFSGVDQCVGTDLLARCEIMTDSVLNFLGRLHRYACGRERQRFRASLPCLTREIPSIGRRCLAERPYMTATRNGSIYDKMKQMMCSGEIDYEGCIGREVQRRCGNKANRLLIPVVHMYNHLVFEDLHFDCKQPDIAVCEPYLQRHGRALLIGAPIAGGLLLIIIITVAVVCVRRRRRAADKAQEKKKLATNDLLQENLRFSLEQNPKEKMISGDLKA